MGRKEKSYSDHHILPQHPFGTHLEGSSHPHNIIRIPDIQHRSQHNLYQNFMIAKQLVTCVELSSKALLPEVERWLVDTLTNTIDPNDPTLRYKEECIR